MTASKIHVVVLAGGSGSRMGGGEPKQFLSLKGRPLLAHSLRAFSAWPHTASLCLITRPEDEARVRAIAADAVRDTATPLTFAMGGGTRHASTLAGIAAVRSTLGADDLIFIHDAARPLIDHAELDRLRDVFADETVRIASLAGRVTDTIVTAAGLPGVVSGKLNRDTLFAVKTPQALRVRVLEELLAIPERTDFTDLLLWGAAANMHGTLVEASPLNHKVTTAADLRFLESAGE